MSRSMSVITNVVKSNRNIERPMPNVENHEWSYINVPGKTNLVHKTVGQLVTEAAKIHGEKEAVVFLNQNIRR